MRRPTPSAATALLALALPLSACAASAPTSAPEPSQKSTSAAGDPADGLATEASAAPSNVGTASPELGEPVGTRSITYQGGDFTLAMYPLKRIGSTIVMTADLGYAKVNEDSALTNRDILSDSTDQNWSRYEAPDGFALLDGSGSVMYLPARSGEEETAALCSPMPSGHAEVGDVETVTCTFAGTPENVTMMSVQTERFGTFSNVPVK